ncbi:PaaI family thioesterase [Bacillus sp. F19]|nr:PaaI family thioesterase [Bacillus sp. F19]
MFIKQAFDEFLSLEYTRVDFDQIKVKLPIVPLYLNSIGVVHGGIIATLADVAIGNLLPITNQECTQEVVTLDMNITYLEPATGEYLIAVASPVRIGKTIIHGECKIYDDKNNIVANSSAILKKIRGS